MLLIIRRPTFINFMKVFSKKTLNKEFLIAYIAAISEEKMKLNFP